MCLKKFYVNDFVLLFLSFLYVFTLLLTDNAQLSLFLSFLALLNVALFRELKIKYLLFFLLTIFPGLLVIFIVSTVFSKIPENSDAINSLWKIGGIKIYAINLDTAIKMVVRTFSLSLCSFVFILHIHFEKAALCAMKTLHLPVKIGYPIIAMSNAFKVLSAEFSRIRMAYRLRFGNNIHVFKMIYPLLISASRYASVCAMSLEARGLNENKTFLTECTPWHFFDSFIVVINVIIVALFYKI